MGRSGRCASRRTGKRWPAAATTRCAIGYGRRTSSGDPLLPVEDTKRQITPLITYTENDPTDPVLLDDAYRTPMPAETRTFELTGFAPGSDADKSSSAKA